MEILVKILRKLEKAKRTPTSPGSHPVPSWPPSCFPLENRGGSEKLAMKKNIVEKPVTLNTEDLSTYLESRFFGALD